MFFSNVCRIDFQPGPDQKVYGAKLRMRLVASCLVIPLFDPLKPVFRHVLEGNPFFAVLAELLGPWDGLSADIAGLHNGN